jgi:hypothetical protein
MSQCILQLLLFTMACKFQETPRLFCLKVDRKRDASAEVMDGKLGGSGHIYVIV